MDDVLAGSADTNVYAIDGATGMGLWTYRIPKYQVVSVAAGDLNGDCVDNVLAGALACYAIAGAGEAALPMSKLAVQLTVSKTYVDIQDDWTLARTVVTNVGVFPANCVWIICHTPDGTDNYIFYEEILPSNSKTATWNLTSGNGLPTVKKPSAMQISYTISVEVRASNCPTELAEVEIIVDSPC